MNGAVNYLRVLDANDYDRSKPKLTPLSLRFAQISLYLNYEALAAMGNCAVTTGVLDAYHDDLNIAKPAKARRDRLSGIHVRRGRWWWRFAASLGFGILLVADTRLIKALSVHSSPCRDFANLPPRSSDSFTNDQIDAFIAFALRARPGTVRLFRSLEPVAWSLLFGTVPPGVRHDLENGLLSASAIHRAHGEDQQALALLRTSDPWEVEDTRILANKTKTDFLDSVHMSTELGRSRAARSRPVMQQAH